MQIIHKNPSEVQVGETFLFLDTSGEVVSSFVVTEVSVSEFGGVSLLSGGSAFACFGSTSDEQVPVGV